MQDQFDSTDDMRTKNNTMNHKYRTLTNDEKSVVECIKDRGLSFLEYLDGLKEVFPEKNFGRELAIAKTKLEEVVMWSVKGVTK